MALTVQAQDGQRKCGAMDNLAAKVAADPTLETRMNDVERHTQEYAASGQHSDRAVVTIPVVFHIIHNGDAVGSGENVSDTYINAQLDQLNKDFRKLNSDASLIPSLFAGVAADAEIQFCLAQRTPAGAATTGINRLNQGQASWTMNQIESSLKPSTIWDRNKYLNLWTVVFGGSDAGTLGYAQFPGGAANTDGVVLLYSSLGSTAVTNPAGGAYGKGRTCTHEVGHWLNLRHIWGDATCGSDLVSDTPTHNTANYGCPTYPHASTCSGAPTEMTMNYMDYTDDACMYMFSAGQKTRMQALFAAGGSRASLATSDGCTAPSGGGGGTTCGNPASLAASSVTASSASLSWSAVSGATSYNVQYKTSSATTWTTGSVTSNGASLSGLTASTTYNWQVQAVCSGGSSAYVAGANFTTLASGGGGTTTCTDAYESNNSKSTAKTISKNADLTALISSTTDLDWFKFTTTTADPKVKINLWNLPADYDVKLYRGNSLVGTSETTGTTEQIIYNGTNSAYTYYVYVYGYGGANSTSCYSFRASTGLSNFRTTADAALEETEINALSFDVLPNPVADYANLVLSPSKNPVDVAIFDMTGKMVLSLSNIDTQTQSNVALDFSRYAQGMYLVRVQSGEAIETRRVMVSH